MRPAIAAACTGLLIALLAGCGDDETTTVTVTEVAGDQTGLPEERCREAESPPNIVDVISYGADCGAVADAMAEIGSVSTEFRIGDFQCSRVSGSELSGTWECRGEASYFTFQFGD